MFRNQSVNVHQFSMVPRAEIPRSSFRMQKARKSTFDSGYLVPCFCEEVLPGDTFRVSMTAFCRLATPIFPVMDNLHIESFFFFVPNRLTWSNWRKFCGEQRNPGDSISYSIPQVVSPAGGYAVGSLFDQFGLPTVGQVGAGNTVTHSALPLRAYALIYDEWFRDENLIGSQLPATYPGDGPDLYTSYGLFRRGKRHDYFTSCLPWTQKGTPVPLPLGTTAVVIPNPAITPPIPKFRSSTGDTAMHAINTTAGGTALSLAGAGSTAGAIQWENSAPKDPANTALVADLSTATAATINQIRQAFQIQRLLERDARGGTRYTEIVRAHFGVVSPDARLQRPEYLGGGSSPIVINSVAQTSATGVTGATTPIGTLSAVGTAIANRHGFTQSFTEHGYIIGIVSVRADLSYQQGLRRHWSRLTRYDYYWPAFAMLGEQAVLNKEIYCDGSANDSGVFGYQERWAEYRYNPSEICGLFKSTAAGTIDAWHLSQRFTTLPTLNSQFIDDTPPLSRVLAVGTAANGQQLLADFFFDIVAARPMPTYSVPGLIDHF